MKISEKAQAFYLATKPELVKELNTSVEAYTISENEVEILGFRFVTPNTGGNTIYVATNYNENAEDILRKYLMEAKKHDLMLHLSFKDYSKFL